MTFVGFPSRRPTSFVSVMTSQWLNDAPSGSPLRIITGIDGISSMNQHKSSVDAEQQEGPLCSSPEQVLSPNRQVASPIGTCDGWCKYDPTPRPTVVSAICAWCKAARDIDEKFSSPTHRQLSLSACEDLQRAWESPRGSLTAVLCRFLSQHTLLEYNLLYAMKLTDIWPQRKTLIHHTAR
jgi:hypothetical protein